MTLGSDPSVNRRLLRAELRRARERSGLTQRGAADAVEWSTSKLVRIEAGQQGTSVADVRALLDLYEVPEATRDILIDAAKVSRARPWWHRYREIVTPEFGVYPGYERRATRIEAFHPYLVPELARTEEYANALLRATLPADRAAIVAAHWLARQTNLFERPKPPDLAFMLGEEVLGRWVGGREAMAGQLRRLAELAAAPGVTVAIIPLRVGVHPGLLMEASVALAVGDDELVRVERPGGGSAFATTSPPSGSSKSNSRVCALTASAVTAPGR
jgi:transcriptional regulator with XRE-family HTH domain